MKKIAILIVMLVLACTLTSCYESGVINSTSSDETVGEYHLFFAGGNSEYLTFLENLDQDKYEIVDISNGHLTWYVTYKDID